MERGRIVGWMMAVLRIGLGLFFLYTGLEKIASLDETAEFLSRCDLLPEWCSFPLAYVGVAMELVVAVCFLFKWLYRAAAIAGVVMTAVFVGLFIQAWIRGLSLSCNCLGDLHAINNYPYEVAMRVLLLAAMILLLWDSRRTKKSPWKFKSFDFSEV